MTESDGFTLWMVQLISRDTNPVINMQTFQKQIRKHLLITAQQKLY